MAETFYSKAIGHIYYFTDEISEADMRDVRSNGLIGDIIVIHGALLSLIADKPELYAQLLSEFPTPVRPEGKINYLHMGTSSTNRETAYQLSNLLHQFEAQKDYATLKLGFVLLQRMYQLVIDASEPPYEEAPATNS